MKKLTLAWLLSAAALAAPGCDIDVNKTPASSENAESSPNDVQPTRVEVDVPADHRIERREERRENIREAIDSVDVEVEGGGVKVDIDGE